MEGYLAIAPISVLVAQIFILLILRLLPARFATWLRIGPISLALVATAILFARTRDSPIEITLLVWQWSPESLLNFAYHVDTYAAYLASLAALLILSAEVISAAWRPHFTEGRWHHSINVALLAITLHLMFAANFATLFIGWFALGLGAFATTAATPFTTATPQRSDRFVIHLALGYLLQGSLLMIARDTQSIPIAAQFSLSLLPSLFITGALAAYLGLYPFRLELAYSVDSDVSLPTAVRILPVFAGLYVLGRLYHLFASGSSPALVTMLSLSGLATMGAGVLAAWQAANTTTLFARLLALEIGLIVLAFTYTNVNGLYAALLLITNMTLATQAFQTSRYVRARRVASTTSVSAASEPSTVSKQDYIVPSRWGVLATYLPYLSLLGIPFTLGFLAKSLLLAQSSSPRYLLVSGALIATYVTAIVATLRFAERSSLESHHSHAQPNQRHGLGTSDILHSSDVDSKLDHLTIREGARLFFLLLPFLAALAPNQAIHWLITPAAKAIAAASPPAHVVPQPVTGEDSSFSLATVVALAVVFAAFWLYPIPHLRRTILRSNSEKEAIPAGTDTAAHQTGFERVVELIWAVAHWANAQVSQLWRSAIILRDVSRMCSMLYSEAHQRYYLQTLTILGIILLFLFIG